MSRLDEWAVTLAHAAAPDEVDFAPAMAEAYAKGGAARRELLAEASSTPGGFGAGDAPVFAYLLSGLGSAASALRDILENHELVKNMLTAVTVGLTVVDFRLKLKKAKQAERQPVETPEGTAINPEVAVKLSRLIDTMRAELKKSGLDEDACDLVTFRTMKALLSQPNSARAFVDELAGR